jgi:hypothetical protein
MRCWPRASRASFLPVELFEDCAERFDSLDGHRVDPELDVGDAGIRIALQERRDLRVAAADRFGRVKQSLSRGR